MVRRYPLRRPRSFLPSTHVAAAISNQSSSSEEHNVLPVGTIEPRAEYTRSRSKAIMASHAQMARSEKRKFFKSKNVPNYLTNGASAGPSSSTAYHAIPKTSRTSNFANTMLVTKNKNSTTGTARTVDRLASVVVPKRSLVPSIPRLTSIAELPATMTTSPALNNAVQHPDTLETPRRRLTNVVQLPDALETPQRRLCNVVQPKAALETTFTNPTLTDVIPFPAVRGIPNNRLPYFAGPPASLGTPIAELNVAVDLSVVLETPTPEVANDVAMAHSPTLDMEQRAELCPIEPVPGPARFNPGQIAIDNIWMISAGDQPGFPTNSCSNAEITDSQISTLNQWAWRLRHINTHDLTTLPDRQQHFSTLAPSSTEQLDQLNGPIVATFSSTIEQHELLLDAASFRTENVENLRTGNSVQSSNPAEPTGFGDQSLGIPDDNDTLPPMDITAMDESLDVDRDQEVIEASFLLTENMDRDRGGQSPNAEPAPGIDDQSASALSNDPPTTPNRRSSIDQHLGSCAALRRVLETVREKPHFVDLLWDIATELGEAG